MCCKFFNGERTVVLICFGYREGCGKYCTLNSFHENQICVRRPEGTIVAFPISPYPSLLYNFAAKNKWSQITNLCRNAKDSLLWACLAGLATATKKLDLAEIAYAAINKVGLLAGYLDDRV